VASAVATPISCNGGDSSVTVSASGGTGPYTGTGTFSRKEGTYTFTVTDANGCTGMASVTITEPKILVASAIATPISCNGGDSSVTVSASGGTGPYTGTGTFNRKAGTYTFTVTDANGCTGMASVTITEPSAISLALTKTDATCAGNDGAVTATFSGGTGAFMISIDVGPFAPGVSPKTFAGLASGSHTVTVKDNNGCALSQTIMVPQKCQLTLSCVGSSGQVGTSFSSALVVTGGTAPYTFSVASGSLPTGLTLDPKTGIISGTPKAAGSFCFTGFVTDAKGLTATAVCSSGCSASSAALWNFSTPSGALGSSQTYTVNGLIITAAGFAGANTPTSLYGKNLGGNESGLGIASDKDHEINTSTYIQLDLKQLIDAGAQNVQLIIGSVQSGEGYNIYGSAVPGSIGALLLSDTKDNTAFAMPGYPTYRYVSVRASAANVLLGSVGASLSCGCTITIAPSCLANITGTIRGDCDRCVGEDRDHDDRDHDGKDHSKCNHKYNECGLDGGDHSKCRHERGWCARDGRDHSSCDHKNDRCSIDSRDHSRCVHTKNICAHDGHKHAECNHARGMCSDDGRDHSNCNHRYAECDQDGQDHSNCRHQRGWCSKDGRNHGYCSHSSGRCTVDTRDHSGCAHSLNICSQDGHDHSTCGHYIGVCKVVPGGQCGLAGFTVQLKDSTGALVASQTTAADGSFRFTGQPAGVYQVIVVPLANYTEFADPDSVLDNKTTVTVANCRDVTGVDFSYRDSGLRLACIAGVIHGACDFCSHEDRDHDDRDHDGRDHSKCNHHYNQCSADGRDHRSCRHERGWCSWDSHNHTTCDHWQYSCAVDTRDHGSCNHYRSICVHDGYKHSECNHARGLCRHDGRDHSDCNHRYAECSRDGQDHTGCRHERGWCKRDGRDHSSCSHDNDRCSVDTRDHSSCNHSIHICSHDGHDHSNCDHVHGGCAHDKSGQCGLAGATVVLKGSGGNVIATLITGLDGTYRFVSLAPGSYQVAVTPPANYIETSDPDGVLDDRTSVTAVACQCKKGVDFTYKPAIPAPPTGVTETEGSGRVTLSWTATPGATSYNIGRATCKFGPYQTIATGVTGTSYTDNDVVNGTAYYYVVTSVRGGVASGASAEVSAIPAASLPSPWTTRDIGAVSDTGAASYASGRFTVVGSGADIWNSADEFRFAYQLASGDCSVVARVASMGSTDPWSKAGVMIRESLTDTSKHASVFVTPSSGVAFQYRSSTGGSSANANTTGLAAPYWVKIVRSGNTFTAYRSSNGSTWTTMGSTTIIMGSTVYIGLAVTSHKDGDLCPAVFDYVTATP
ncbi:MAG: putative Ig domain-containing protein, partial [Verrucomicrobia bacterium]|nr:putative Ig domain-containing protein [Verrucomicrobiota bacterium]